MPSSLFSVTADATSASDASSCYAGNNDYRFCTIMQGLHLLTIRYSGHLITWSHRGFIPIFRVNASADSLRPSRQTYRRLIPRRLSPVRRRLANVTRPPIDANDDGDAISDVAAVRSPFCLPTQTKAVAGIERVASCSKPIMNE